MTRTIEGDVAAFAAKLQQHLTTNFTAQEYENYLSQLNLSKLHTDLTELMFRTRDDNSVGIAATFMQIEALGGESYQATNHILGAVRYIAAVAEEVGCQDLFEQVTASVDWEWRWLPLLKEYKDSPFVLMNMVKNILTTATKLQRKKTISLGAQLGVLKARVAFIRKEGLWKEGFEQGVTEAEVLVQRHYQEPTEAQYHNPTVRQIIVWLGYDHPTPNKLLKLLGRVMPADEYAWICLEPEMSALDAVVTKGTRAVLIYKAMMRAAQGSTL